MKNNLIRKLIVQAGIFFGLFALAVFVPAGRVDWLAGWVFLVAFLVFYLAVNAWLYRHNPGLMEERLSLARPDQKGWDKVLFPLMLLFSLG